MITKFKIYENKIKMKMDIPNDIIEFKKEFDKAGKKLFIVGGAVRDFLMNNEPHDFDLVTNAKPDEVIKILKNFKTDEQGKSFGVVRVFTKDEPEGYEIATFRKDISKGRDNKSQGKKVDFGKHITIDDDVHRRDFSQNALFYDLDTEEIIDLVGGLEDIKQNKIVAVGDPSKRFEEDRLRILRAFRFASRNLSEIDPKTIQAIKKDNRLRNISGKLHKGEFEVDDVSQERIIDEFFKTIRWAKQHNKLESVEYYLYQLNKYGMLKEMFPGVRKDIGGITTFNISIIFAMLFRETLNYDRLRKKMYEFKIPNKKPKYIDETIFLLKLDDIIKLNINIDKIPELYKEKKRIQISNNTIEEFAEMWNINKDGIDAFLLFNPKIDGRELIKMGYKGSEIGKEIKRREIEEFKRLLDMKNQSKKYNL